ncbi:hypothetical protein TRV_06557 [Trichophyton verrucosum HKI 0517]|uniref:Uncharacterized protein n=1 Tax=Trichophyton verrucosum (strain HKI 0517) TaxID=663202 RepID=D4DHA1_TRIVH|nr:uncharacterized protein TRV_06557 [Trichophyton verrucosum HKI 0517]EFE38745.1 hypothetical protein TRV_06557 [Trichophyton verrucosum HKI 0517]
MCFCSARALEDNSHVVSTNNGTSISTVRHSLVYACNFTAVAMGKIEPPFLYDPPSLYPKSAQVADFNPKAVTLNSWAPRPQKPKKDGPLVNFNQHPDSVTNITLPFICFSLEEI